MNPDLTIVNLALARFGQRKLSQADLTAGVLPAADAANAFFDPCVTEVLGESDWPFATVTLGLSSLGQDAVGEWGYIYSYPTATLTTSSIFNVYNQGTLEDKTEQEFEVRYVPTLGVDVIYSNLDYAIAEYTYKVTNTALWSAKFKTALSYRLAAEMCVPVSGDTKQALNLMSIYNAFLGEAKRLGHAEKRKAPEESSRYRDAR